mmetsp:Transcript_37575/g.45894  ORF Transcript_37575/g.45894 Transcript_37575/m.45894 type:complete len:973 (-) Transcript_37575:47-2965(-)|eukprot:CAMPEP_0172501184 /NCGR_PEP_ID=MMETSP1066-20121228/147052_1 /TAXON_ID=671091 /ORGANISM="Coscinodiscus wailesii, Strain CCMP2513" /LENGTH=972 /DNA_ID=CAMNT_0013275831 /DNA_START=213 /DNA_END=3131 /DNA_ORIENTATION=+
MPSSKSSSSNNVPELIYNLVWLGLVAYGISFASYWAYHVRLLAIEEFGPIIHEFDPYFNFRATEYLYEHGWKKFVTWFDYMVWYPLGRPVGTTIYPGMQVAAVFLKNVIGNRMSLNDICVYIPAWFGVIASLLTGLMAYECSLPQNGNVTVVTTFMNIFRTNKVSGPETRACSPAVEVGVVTACIMAVVPAHLMRSIGGGYDNESVAVTAMVLTFYLWVRSLRANDDKSYLWSIGAGLAYFNMAATWGGYVFVLNMIGVHAAALVLLGRFSRKVYRSYTLFYFIGTLLAIQIPVVGMTPLKSLEQLGPCAVFFGYQVLFFCRYHIIKRKMSRVQALLFYATVFMVTIIVGSIIIWSLAPTGYFGPISSRVRGLFVKHTRTGNPLVDSVAEHQPASQQAYFQYLHYLYYTAPVGFLFVFMYFGDAPSFLVLYAIVAYFFSAKMVRLVLLLAPIASALGGVAVGRVGAWSVRILLSWFLGVEDDLSTETNGVGTDSKANVSETSKKGKGKKKGAVDAFAAETPKDSGFVAVTTAIKSASKSKEGKILKRILSLLFLGAFVLMGQSFKDYCWMLCRSLSQATIVIKGRTRDGKEVLVDDYRDAYLWLKDNTPANSRILAWWDYGYQITAIANRTTIADGNTWNHEHIALLGRVLTTSVDEGYEIARHLADYVLVWAGGGGDDLAKSPHLARIANSVYRTMCPNDPTCRAFGFIDKHGTPSAMMKRSFLYNLHSHNIRPGVTADPAKFKEVYRSRYGKVRIYKLLGVSRASKEWVANPKNKLCDVPGSWFCRGQYPPALKAILDEKKDFGQLEDFNRKNVDEEYTKQYFENMADPTKAKEQARRVEREEKNKNKKISKDEDLNELIKKWKAKLSDEDRDRIYNNWADTDDTTLMWRVVSTSNVMEFKEIMSDQPELAFVRSADGRGPMWWAYESVDKEIAYILTMLGVSNKDKDKYGMTPYDLLPEKEKKKRKNKL